MTEPERTRHAGQPVLLYDGHCALCHGVVRFVLRHDHEGRFRFAPLESEVARNLLGTAASLGDGVAVVTSAWTPQQAVARRSDATVAVLRLLGWSGTARLLALVPRPLRELGYAVVARLRYRLFGRYSVCPLPPAEARDRFLAP